ncbi:MAG: nickel pincer cofactor biosynthesis protein LarC [Spirochaetota bacterium]|nr:nickel pincer cofactor biosynthesis protein LarC [Spirochaetota bacterium]
MSNCIIFDIHQGASGDMLLGSMLALGLDINKLKNELNKLTLPKWDIFSKITVKKGLKGTLIKISYQDDQQVRYLSDIADIIQKNNLSEKIKNNALAVFQKLASAEASVHGTSVDQIHFHEIGAIDSIIDITAFCISLDILKIDSFYFNEFHFGSGSIQSSHGELPIPVPAVLELTKGFKSRLTERRGEIVTPTAAALLTSLGTQINEFLDFVLLKSGIGFGTRDYPVNSLTRSLLINIEDSDIEDIFQIECNIDDLNPQAYPYVIDKIIAQGALDAYFTQIFMKKGRPGILLTIISKNETLDSLKETIYRETTTLGMRIQRISRERLERSIDTIHLDNNLIRIKKGYYKDKVVNIQPEYEDCRKAAEKNDIPLRDIMDKAIFEYCRKHVID